MAALVRQEKEKVFSVTTCLSLRPPYPISIATKPYPVGYAVPNFQKFDGRRGNTIEHIARFIDALGPFAHNSELCLREFSKSLTDQAYTWYLNLKPRLIQDWDHLVTLFNAKFFCGDAKFTLVELSRTRQYSGEDLDVYVRRFRERALYCSDAVDEETLIGVCLHGMVNEYRVYLENLTFPSFSKLIEAARRTNESVRKPSRSTTSNHSGIAPRSFSRKRPVVAAVEDGQGLGLPSQRNLPSSQDTRQTTDKKRRLI